MKNTQNLVVYIALFIGAIFIFVLVATRGENFNKTERALIEIAKEVGLDEEKFKQDLKSSTVTAIIDTQKKEALSRIGGIAQTPTIFIDESNYRLTGATPQLMYSDLKIELQKRYEATKNDVLLVVYSDYNCHVCFDLESAIFAILDDKELNFVKFEQKNLPFLKESSYLFAQAAVAAELQGNKREFISKLYKFAQQKDVLVLSF